MRNSKRFLLVITQADWGGAQTFVFRAAREAMRRGVEVLVTAGGEGQLEERCREANVPYRRLTQMHRALSVRKDIAGTRELVTLMHEWKPDVVLLHSSKAGVIGSIAARIAKIPKVIYRIGGWSFLDPVSPMSRMMRFWSEKLTAGLKDVIIVNDPAALETAQKRGIRPRKTVELIANGMDLNAFDAALKSREDARRELQTNAEVPLLLTIGNFYPAKGLEDYLDALAIVHQARPEIRAVICGDGELRNALEAKRRALGLEHVVALPGQNHSAATLLRGADVFVLPSRKEGMSWALLEAMAAASPIVTTDAGAARWMLEDRAAWIVPTQNPTALANAIIDALRDSASAHIQGVAARRIVENRFTEQEMWERLFGIIETNA